MRDIPKVRFDALAAYCRDPMTFLLSDELRWLELDNEKLLAVVIRDIADGDFAGILLARDAMERYRFVQMTAFFASVEEATAEAHREAGALIGHIEEERVQGDEQGAPVNFFAPIVRQDRLHPDFVHLSSTEGYSPARDIIVPMMRWHEDADGNFVEQFQTTGFDARIWELYIFAMLVEAGFVLDRANPVPDFVCTSPFGDVCVEATTVNAARDVAGAIVPPPPNETEEQAYLYLREYAPIKYAGPLTAKLAKRYWERENVAGMPLVFAIQDFHVPMAMTITRASLPIYLYGYDHDWYHEPDGSLVITPRKVEVHSWGAKQVPSGFFDLPGAENISAVIFNSSATISKFNRMGVIASFGSKRVRLERQGLWVDFDPNAVVPIQRTEVVNDPAYVETWIEGMDVYHNPRALIPLDPDMLRGAAHHRLMEDGMLQSLVPPRQPFTSITIITVQD